MMNFFNKITTKIIFLTVFLISTTGYSFINFEPVVPITGTGLISEAAAAQNELPSITDFADRIKNGNAKTIRGVFVEDNFALEVLQQPAGNPGFVSPADETATQFGLAAKNNITGLLAHNFAAGSYFFDLQLSDVVDIIYGDGSIQSYKITKIKRYQALSPRSASSDFLDLETNEKLSAASLFGLVYTGSHHLTLQTCIQEGNEDSWGRLFIIAEPI